MTDVLTIRDASRRFPPNVVALEAASLSVRKGEVHCLLNRFIDIRRGRG